MIEPKWLDMADAPKGSDDIILLIQHPGGTREAVIGFRWASGEDAWYADLERREPLGWWPIPAVD